MLTAYAKAMVLAFMFLTRLPMPRLQSVSPEDNGRAMACFPLVGLCLGFMLAAVGAWAVAADKPALGAALVVACWAAITGGIHLDGLADSADAWLGGHGNPERAMEIMKDPRAGSAAVVAVGILFLLKFAAVYTLLAAGSWWPIALAPALGRALSLSLFLTTPYVRPGGLASDQVKHLPRTLAWALVAACVAWGLWLGQWAMLLAALALLLWLRRRLIARLGGTTGDTAGALLELGEALALVAAATLI